MIITRWLCEKCSKKWIYPVEKCVYCKGSITKQKGTKLKVAGMTKVFISSPMHPIVPYNILLLQDEHGNRQPKKTMKDYKIGDSYVEQKATSEDAVSIVKVKYDIYEAICDSLDLLKDAGIKKSDKILIKPSIVLPAYPYQAVNTNPEFLNALLMVMLDYGIKKENIMVAEQALIGSDSMDAAVKSGILDVCKKNGVSFVDIHKGHFEEIDVDGYKMSIFKEALKRKVINCPVMKTNFQLGISGALENLSRLAEEKTQRKMYFDDIEKTLPMLIKSIPDVINIADATNGLQGQGPLFLGEPAFLNLVLASKSAAALDIAFCDIAMIPLPNSVIMSSNGLDAKKIEIVGNDPEALKYRLKQPIPDETAHSDIKLIDARACPACINAMNSLTSKLIGVRGEQIWLVTGHMINEGMLEGKKRLVALGECAIKRLDSLQIKDAARISEDMEEIEQILLLKKLLMTSGIPKITPVDKVKTKMKKLLYRVSR